MLIATVRQLDGTPSSGLTPRQNISTNSEEGRDGLTNPAAKNTCRGARAVLRHQMGPLAAL